MDQAAAAEERANDQLIKLYLVNCIAHLLETLRDDSNRELDMIAAQACLVPLSVQEYLGGLDPVMITVPRDGKEPLTFPPL